MSAHRQSFDGNLATSAMQHGCCHIVTNTLQQQSCSETRGIMQESAHIECEVEVEQTKMLVSQCVSMIPCVTEVPIAVWIWFVVLRSPKFFQSSHSDVH